MQKGPSDTDLKAVSNKFIALLKEYESIKQWELLDDKPVIVSRLERQDRVVAKAEIIMNLPFEVLAKYFEDCSFMKKIADRISAFEILYKHPEFSVFHVHMQGVAMVSDREVVAVFTFLREGNKAYFGNRSCEYPCSPYKDTVRGFAHCGGYILEKVGENTTKLTNIMDFDPNGSIPGFLKNKMATMRASALAELEGKIKASLK